MRDRQRPREIRQEDDARLERRYEQWITFRVGVRQLPAELPDPASDFRAGEVDLPDRTDRRAQEASLSR
jgi:hypothetical protein